VGVGGGTVPDMVEPGGFEQRLADVEETANRAAGDALLARKLAGAVDRDISDLTRRVAANTEVISALGVQTRAQFDAVDLRFDAVDARFDRIDGRLDRIDGRLDRIDGRLDRIDGRLDQVVRLLTDRNGD
jgi:hypothetical protein